MKYRTIVADPPWQIEGYPVSLPSGRDHRVMPGIGVRRQLNYQTMRIDDIARLPIATLADTDCRLFLWTTNAWLPASFGVVEAWGFIYRQTLVWSKRLGGPYLGSVAPNTAEFLLVATKGKPERTGSLPATVMSIAAPRRNGVKPEAWLDWIEQVSPGPYVEIFARRHRLGWDVCGNESANTATLGQVS
jgi:N6-adenosine-specific RNA methylase IME4